MAGINGVSSSFPTAPASYTPPASGSDGAGVAAMPPRRRMPGDSLDIGGVVRMSEPVVKAGLEQFGGQAQGWLGRIFGGGGAGGTMSAGWGSFGNGLESAGAVGGSAGGVMGGLSGIGNALKNGLGMFGAALKSNLLVSAVLSGVGNVIDVMQGKETPRQALATFAVDTAAYTGIGATSTVIGATLGSLIPIPFVGTLIGAAVGIGVGFLYEKTVRPGLVNAAQGMLGG